MSMNPTAARLIGAFVVIAAAGVAPMPVPTAAQAETQQNCVSMEVRSGGMFVTNNCPHPVIGRFCYENDQYFNCGTQSPGGFGPISSGNSESVHGPSSSTGWRARWFYCNHDDWNRGECTVNNP